MPGRQDQRNGVIYKISRTEHHITQHLLISHLDVAHSYTQAENLLELELDR